MPQAQKKTASQRSLESGLSERRRYRFGLGQGISGEATGGLDQFLDRTD